MLLIVVATPRRRLYHPRSRVSWRPRLAASVISPLRFAITSRPSRCEEDFHLQTVKHCSEHIMNEGDSKSSLAAGFLIRVATRRA